MSDHDESRPPAADYPAAHSMDTEWFAVDRNGCVGLFESGENGPVPRGCPQGGAWDVLHRLLGRPGEPDDAEIDELDHNRTQILKDLGLFLYGFEDYPDGLREELLDAYTIDLRPEKPCHADQLPPDVRRLVKKNRFATLSYAEQEAVQPVVHLNCQLWSSDVPAYLADDGVTIRPMPGRKREFAAFCRRLREQYPEESKRFRFDPDPDAPAPKPKRTRPR